MNLDPGITKVLEIVENFNLKAKKVQLGPEERWDRKLQERRTRFTAVILVRPTEELLLAHGGFWAEEIIRQDSLHQLDEAAMESIISVGGLATFNNMKMIIEKAEEEILRALDEMEEHLRIAPTARLELTADRADCEQAVSLYLENRATR